MAEIATTPLSAIAIGTARHPSRLGLPSCLQSALPERSTGTLVCPLRPADIATSHDRMHLDRAILSLARGDKTSSAECQIFAPTFDRATGFTRIRRRTTGNRPRSFEAVGAGSHSATRLTDCHSLGQSNKGPELDCRLQETACDSDDTRTSYSPIRVRSALYTALAGHKRRT